MFFLRCDSVAEGNMMQNIILNDYNLSKSVLMVERFLINKSWLL